MKNNLRVTAIALILICFLFSCRHHGRYHGLDVSISESGNIYKLSARFNENRTREVQEYINDQIRPSGLFQSPDDYFDVTTSLKDDTRFYIKSSPGNLVIKINKRENTRASYLRIKDMCEGVVAVLKEN